MVEVDTEKAKERLANSLRESDIDVESLVETELGDTLSEFPELDRLLVALLLESNDGLIEELSQRIDEE